MQAVEETLEQRGEKYGKFSVNSRIAQRLKIALGSVEGAHDVEREAAHQICAKLSRWASNVAAEHTDNWQDIAGYATLVVQYHNYLRELETGRLQSGRGQDGEDGERHGINPVEGLRAYGDAGAMGAMSPQPERAEEAKTYRTIEEVLNQFVEMCHTTARDSGFWARESVESRLYVYATKLMLIVSEASEALEVLREGYMDMSGERRSEKTGFPHFREELADILIRTADLLGHMDHTGATEATDASDYYSAGRIITEKMQHNMTRKMKHGKKF